MSPRSVNAAGISLIESFESLSLTPYQDSVGVWTIGYGHTEDVSASSSPISEEEADTYLNSDLATAETEVGKYINATLNDNQFSALVSLVFNTGAAPLTHTLGTLLNAGNYANAADEFLKWNHAGGKISNGLTRRREAERELFLS